MTAIARMLSIGLASGLLMAAAAPAGAQAITSDFNGQTRPASKWHGAFMTVWQPGAPKPERRGDPIASTAASLRASSTGGWFAEATAYRHVGTTPAPWLPDFGYQAGYANWRPGTLSVTFASGVNAHITPDRAAGERALALDQGTLTASYRVPLGRGPDPWGMARWTDALGIRAIYRMTPRYAVADGGPDGCWKQTLSASVAFAVRKNWFAQMEATGYLGASQQPWDSDVTFSAGYRPWQPRTWTVLVQNYSGLRWAGHRSAGSGGGLRSTQIAVGFQW